MEYSKKIKVKFLEPIFIGDRSYEKDETAEIDEQRAVDLAKEKRIATLAVKDLSPRGVAYWSRVNSGHPPGPPQY